MNTFNAIQSKHQSLGTNACKLFEAPWPFENLVRLFINSRRKFAILSKAELSLPEATCKQITANALRLFCFPVKFFRMSVVNST